MPSRIRVQNELVLRDQNVGIGTSLPTSKLTIVQSSNSSALDIGRDLRVSGDGTFSPSITIGSTVSAASTQKINLGVVSRENGLLEVDNYGGNQIFSISNDQSSELFTINRYYNFGGSTGNRKLLSVDISGNISGVGSITGFTNASLSGNVSGLGTFRLGNAAVGSSIFNEIHGGLILKPTFSTSTTDSVNIIPKFSDRGAISFESPVGTAQTNLGNQIFSISNNFDSTIFAVNDLNRNSLFRITESGNVGIGTSNPVGKLEVIGTTRVSSVGSTSAEQIDIRHYRNIALQPTIGFATDNRGALSFDGPTGFSTDGVSFYPASLFAITNDPGGNIFSVSGYEYFSSNVGRPAIDVTQYGRIGIGTTNPAADFEIRRNTYVTGEFQIQNKINFSNSLNPASTSYVRLTPYTSSLGPSVPTRGSVIFDGESEYPGTNGGQLVTILNDNTSLFRVSKEVGITSIRPAPVGTTPIDTVLEISQSGRIGIGATNLTNLVQINESNQLISSVIANASSIGISTTIIGINTSGITVGLEIQEYYGVIAAGTTVTSIGTTQIGIGRTTLNDFIRTSTVLTFGSRSNDRVITISPTGFVGLGLTNPSARLDVNGNVGISGIATVGLGSTSSPTANSTMSFELTNNTTLTVRVRGSDGVVRTGIITLS